MIRRPMLPLCLAMLGGVLSSYMLEIDMRACIVICVALVLFATFFLHRSISADRDAKTFYDRNARESLCKDPVRTKNVYVALATLIMFCWGAICMAHAGYGEELKEEKAVYLTGVVQSVQKKDEKYYRLIVHVSGKGGVMVGFYDDLNEKASGYGYSSANMLVGHSLKVKGDLKLPRVRSNPGCFDHRLYLRSVGVKYTITASVVDAGSIQRPLLHRIAVLRSRFEETITKDMNERQRQIVVAMMFGDKSEMEDDLYESFQRNGTAHILAVSGLHIGMIYALFASLIGGRRRIGTNIAIAVLLFGYTAMAGFSPSVIRAVIMIILHIIARLAHYRYDLVSAGCLSCMIMLSYRPYYLFGSGFVLSFLAISIIGWCMPLADQLRVHGPVKILLITPVMIQLGMIPVTAYLFNYVSLTAIIANIPVVFMAGLIVPFGVVVMMIFLVVPDVVPSAGGVLGTMTSFMTEANDLTYLSGKFSFDVTSPHLVFILSLYGIGFFVLSEWARVKWHRSQRHEWACALIIVGVVMVLSGIRFGNDFLKADLVFVDVGQGACVHIRTDVGHDILIDGGGKTNFSSGGANIGSSDNADENGDGRKSHEKKSGLLKQDHDTVGKNVLRPYLLKNGVRRVDIAMVTHLDSDHYKGIATICMMGMVKKLALHECLKDEEEKVLNETGMKKEDVYYLHTGQIIKDGKTKLTVMAPVVGAESGAGSSTEANENSMVVKVEKKNMTTLVTGDIDDAAERALISSYDDLGCDIVSVPHHGSRYSSTQEFIDKIKPKAAIIQVGKNTYGHPAGEVIDRYEAADCKVFRNDTQGAVGIFGRKIRYMIK